MRETWYVLEGGAVADPNDCAPDAAGVLRHVSGVAVAVGPYGLRSSGVGPDEIAAYRALRVAEPVAPKRKGRALTAGGAASGAYETR